MGLASKLSWFSTQNGKKTVFFAFSGLTAFSAIGYYMPHTFFLDKYVDVMHFYKSGFKVKVTPEVQSRFQESLQLLKTSEVEKKLLKPFFVIGFDLFNAGTSTSKFGAAIGLPHNFSYKSLSDVDKDNIQLNLHPVEWGSEAGEQLADSLIISENAQRFAMCREILMTLSPKFHIDSVLLPIVMFFLYCSGTTINRKMKFFEKPPITRYVMYVLLTTFGTGLYFLFKDGSQLYYEGKADEALCKLGPEYVKAGVEFYDKMLERNKALRRLMGVEGTHQISELGNYNYLFRQKSIPTLNRRNYFMQKLREIEAKQEEDANQDVKTI